LKDQEGSKHILPNDTLQDIFLVGKGNCVWMSVWEDGSSVFVVPRFTAQLNSLHPSVVYEDASHVSNGIPSPFLCCFEPFSCTYSKIMKHTHLNPQTLSNCWEFKVQYNGWYILIGFDSIPVAIMLTRVSPPSQLMTPTLPPNQVNQNPTQI
jgi:hypothetical protein